jgi:hypothetical protein
MLSASFRQAHGCIAISGLVAGQRKMQGWITILIAAIALLIGYFQWVTVHQRVVIDLFEKRLRLFNSIELAIGQVVRDAETSPETLQIFLQADADARFLFGLDVLKELRSLGSDLEFLHTYSKAVIDDPDLPNRDDVFKERWNILQRLGDDWLDRLSRTFAPYIRLTQKQQSIWWPF